jgi:hypothetical protein
MARIALRSRGGEIVGSTLVDDADLEWLSTYKWHLDAYGYARNNRAQLMHRLILDLRPGDEKQSDHINGDRIDNRRSNLRIVTGDQNKRNRQANRGSTSPFVGVSLTRGGKRWRARLVRDGNERNLGIYDTEDEAARAVTAVLAKEAISSG